MSKKRTQKILKDEAEQSMKIEAAVKKLDLDQLKEIKRMETAKRDALLEREEVKEAIEVAAKKVALEKVDFDVWYNKVNRRVKIKSWMKEIIKVDFKARGLGNRETSEKFDDTLRIFGIKF